MANFNFDLETAEYELENIENLLSVFWGFFNEERPLEEKANTTAACLFVTQCKTYESVFVAAWDKVQAIREDMETAIKKQYGSKKDGDAA